MEEPRDNNGLTESEFLEIYKKTNYPRPYLTADLVLFSENKKDVLLIRRKGHPYIGKWAFPGGFANSDETIQQTAVRELEEETGIKETECGKIKEIGLFSKPGRDPRGWVVSDVFAAMVPKEQVKAAAADDAADAQWFSITVCPDGSLTLTHDRTVLKITKESSDLAFDHADVLFAAMEKY